MSDHSIKSIFSDFTLHRSDGFKDIENEATSQHASIVDASRINIQEKQNELESLLANMRNKYDAIKQEQIKIALERKHELDNSLQQAKEEQLKNQETKEYYLAQQRIKLNDLRAQAEERLREMPPEKQKVMSRRLEELMQYAIKKQKELEDRQYKNILHEQEELSKLAQKAQEEQRRLQQEQINRMKSELDGIVKNVASKELEIKEEFRKLSKLGQEEISGLISSAREKHNHIQDKYKNKLEENKIFLKRQIARSKEFIKQGNMEEVKNIQKEIEDVIKKCREDMHEEQKSINSSAKREIIEIAELTEENQKNIIKTQKELIKQAKIFMDKQAEFHMKKIQQDLTMQTRDSIENLKKIMLSRHGDMQSGHIEMVRKVSSNMEKQADDSIRRRYMEQKEIITQTKRNILQLEERSQVDQKKIEKEHKDMVDGARKDLIEIERQTAISQKSFEREQNDLITKTIEDADEFTQKHEHQKRMEEWDLVQIARQRSRHDIGKESYETLLRIEKEKRVAGMQAKLEMVSVGKQAQEIKEQLQKEREQITRTETQGILELKQIFAEKQKATEREHTKRIRNEQMVLDEVIQNANLRRQHIEEEMKDIEDVIKTSESNQNKFKDKNKNEKAAQEHEELLRLISLAKIKHKEIVDDQERIIKEVKIDMEIKIEESKKTLETEQKRLLEKYQHDQENFIKNIEDKKKRLKEEEGMLFKRHDANMQSIMSDAEKEQKAIRNEHIKTINEAQRKLMDVDKPGESL